MASFAPILRLPAECFGAGRLKSLANALHYLRFLPYLGTNAARSKYEIYHLSFTKNQIV